VWTGRGRSSGSGTQPIAGGGGVGSVRAIQTDGISRKTSKCLAGRLITVDNTNTTLTTRVVIVEPEGVVHVLYDYRDGQERTGGARLGVSEARIEAIDGDICLVCGDTGVIKSRLGCRVISGREDELNDITQVGSHTLRHKSCQPIAGGITSNRDDDFLGCRHASTGKNKKGRKVHRWRKGGIERALSVVG